MKINFKQPKYVLPLLALPFLCLFFYVWHSSSGKPGQDKQQQAGLNGSVGSVSSDVRKKELTDKLDAYRNTYKDADGYSAVNVIPKEASSNPGFEDNYSEREKFTLDSIARAMKVNYNLPPEIHDRKLAAMIDNVPPKKQSQNLQPPAKEKDPMDMFRQQMAYMDSISKSNDPEWKAAQQRKLVAEKASARNNTAIKLTVTKPGENDNGFNTVKAAGIDHFISAVIDENVTGYAGSRLRLRLLEDIKAGGNTIGKGTYLFAQISGFSEQRVTLIVTTILAEGKILPVKLEIYDLDGMPGLYVPSSTFREFTKDLGSSSVQGVTIDGNSTGNQFIMSSVDKIFQSTSSAIANLIRKNKAKMKYNSYIYLIDADVLQNSQKSF
jgi:conjugative transposon TraM protein